MQQEIVIQRASERSPKPAESDLGFGRVFTDHMFLMEYAAGSGWSGARIVPRRPLTLDPAAAALHYGQTLFEGMKAFRGQDGKVRLWRADAHSRRLADGAPRLCMPQVDPAFLQRAVTDLVRIDQDWVPSAPGTALYIRPAMIATEAFLGVRPANAYAFFIILTPVGAYYGDATAAVKIWVEDKFVRAPRGGLGAVKAGANYAASLYAAAEAKARGYAQVLWLDAAAHEELEEVGTMNLFVRIGDELITPPLAGSILAGVTRDCVLTLAREWGLTANERSITMTELRAAHKAGTLREVFGCGTAAVISPVAELGGSDFGTIRIGDGRIGEVAARLQEAITSIQYGRIPDTHKWLGEAL